MLSGDVNMWRSIVVGRITRKAMKLTTWAIHQAWCQPATLLANRLSPLSTRVASGYPMKLHFSKPGVPSWAMRNASAPKPVTPMARNTPRITACSGLDLIRIR